MKFNLSKCPRLNEFQDKDGNCAKMFHFYRRESDVKLFIKLLKEELSNPRMVDDHPLAVVQLIEEKINKLAGDDLI